MLIGVNEHMDWDFQKDEGLRTRLLDSALQWNADFIRLDYAWASIQPNSADQWEWDELDGYISECAMRGLKVLIMLYMAPGWATNNGGKPGVPQDAEKYGEVLGQIGKRYKSDVVAVEMWNEPDLPGFWAGTHAQFMDLLAEAYPVAKSIAPDTIFIAGAPTYIGLAPPDMWYPNSYNDDRFRPGVSFDAVAVHPYMSPSDLPPWAPDSDWSVRGIARLQEIRKAHGDNSPLWATEFGWSTHSNDGNEENHQRGVSEQHQASYSIAEFEMLRMMGIAGAAIYTDMDMAQTKAPHERNFGIFRTDESRKPIYNALIRYFDSDIPNPVPPDDDIEDLKLRVAELEDALHLMIGPFKTIVQILEDLEDLEV